MQRLTNTKKILVMTVALSIVLVSGYLYVLWEVFGTNRTVRMLKEEVQKQTLREDTARATKELLLETEGERTKLDSRLLADDEVVPFLEHVEGIGQIAGVSLDVKTVDVVEAEQQQDVYEWLKVSVTAEGSWKKVYHFLTLLEHIPLALMMDRADLDISKEADGTTSSWAGRFDFRVAKKKPQ